MPSVHCALQGEQLALEVLSSMACAMHTVPCSQQQLVNLSASNKSATNRDL